MTGIILATLVVGGVGLIIGILLGIAAKQFWVDIDENEVKIRELLPGSNCGGCGFAGCDALAKAVAGGCAGAGSCPVGGAAVAVEIGKIIGAEPDLSRKIAFVKCAGTCDKAKSNYKYSGNISCKEAMYVANGGPKSCSYGCTGFGSCVAVCEYDAIQIVDGIAMINEEKCVACGKCVKECPKHLIDLIPYEAKHRVRCNSKEKGKDVKLVCGIGCIACKLCEKACEYDAIHVTDNLAKIDYVKCTNCGKCAEKCPVKVIA